MKSVLLTLLATLTLAQGAQAKSLKKPNVYCAALDEFSQEINTLSDPAIDGPSFIRTRALLEETLTNIQLMALTMTNEKFLEIQKSPCFENLSRERLIFLQESVIKNLKTQDIRNVGWVLFGTGLAVGELGVSLNLLFWVGFRQPFHPVKLVVLPLAVMAVGYKMTDAGNLQEQASLWAHHQTEEILKYITYRQEKISSQLNPVTPN